MNRSLVCTMDNSLRGHHKLYLEALKGISVVRDISKELPVTGSVRRLFPYILDRKKIFDYALRQKHFDEILHLLYLDNLYTVGAFLPIPKDTKIIGTLHHFPNSEKKVELLRRFSKKVINIIVHSDYIGKQLEDAHISNFVVIDYPSFHPVAFNTSKRNRLRKDLGIGEGKVVLSALGGTRYDKGLDILLESFKHLAPVCKNRVVFNIAGKEETFNKTDILKIVNETGVEVRLDLKLLSDKEFEENIEITDAIVLPYRNIFTGNSGPMTEGVVYEKPIIGTDFGNIGYLINNYCLGFTFQTEDPKSLANTICNFVQNGWISSEQSKSYQEKLKIEHFIDKHIKLYKQIDQLRHVQKS